MQLLLVNKALPSRRNSNSIFKRLDQIIAKSTDAPQAE